MGELKQHNMKTLLLLSILGLALVSADLQTEEDRYTEEADVVAVDDSAEAMDDLDDNTRRSGYQSLSAKFRFGDDLTADIKVRQSNSEKEKNNARWTSKLKKFNDDICPGGQLNWHVHQYPVSETASSNIRRASPMTAQIENFNIQNAPIAYFASDNGANSPTTVEGSAATSTTSAGKLKLEWSLTGLDDNSSGGIHIHYGTTCQSEATVKGDAPAGADKGHYYVPTDANAVTPGEDPWSVTDARWNSDGDGNADSSIEISEADLGATPGSAYNRVVIVHNNAGKKVGCGVLSFQGSAPGCSPGVAGGHYDPTFACGKASQNNANGICAILRATDQAPAGNGLVQGAYACNNTEISLGLYSQSQCEIGDQSGKMGKIIGVNTGGGARRRRRRATTQKFNDRWMEPIEDNLEGRSLVLHCCSAAGCGDRLACANLE